MIMHAHAGCQDLQMHGAVYSARKNLKIVKCLLSLQEQMSWQLTDWILHALAKWNGTDRGWLRNPKTPAASI